jgi:carbon storage regulator CsrA
MLVLSRKNGETVCINQKIEVKVLSISGNTVKLGFSAPPQVNIRRQELAPMTKRQMRCDRKPLPAAAVYHSLASC